MMKIEYLNAADLGVRWFKNYYRRNPQLNRAKAVAALKNAERILQDNPFAGDTFEDFAAIREKEIVGTSFSLLYTNAHSGVIRPPIPIASGHPYRFNPATQTGASGHP